MSKEIRRAAWTQTNLQALTASGPQFRRDYGTSKVGRNAACPLYPTSKRRISYKMARPLSAPPLRRLGRSSYVRWTTYQELERCTGVSSSAGPSTPRWTRSQSTSTKPKTRGPLIKRPPTDKKTAVVDPKTSYGSSVSASREEMGKARQDWNTSLAWLGEPDKDVSSRAAFKSRPGARKSFC